MGLDKVPTVLITLLVIVAVALTVFIVAGTLGTVAKDVSGQNSYAANATAQLESGMYEVVEDAPTWGKLISIGVLIAIVFGFILGAMYLRRQGYL